MWIGVLWAGLQVPMWITHVGGKFRHGLLEKSLIISQKGLEVCYCLWGCHPDPRLGPILGPSRSWSHPAPERFFQDQAWTGRNRLLGHFRISCFFFGGGAFWKRIARFDSLPIRIALVVIWTTWVKASTVQTGCTAKGEAPKGPLLWWFLAGFDSLPRPLCLRIQAQDPSPWNGIMRISSRVLVKTIFEPSKKLSWRQF